MAREQQVRVSAERHAIVVRDDQWLLLSGAEPSLDELLDDPIMGLLWQADGLEPLQARETVFHLRRLMQCRSGHRRGHVVDEGVDCRQPCCLAA